MIYALLKTIHVFSIIVWIGGMVFAHFFLRPSLASMAPPERLTLMHAVLGRFFKAVLWASSLTLISGIWMIGRVAKATVQSGGAFAMPMTWTVMAVAGVIMVAIFGHIRFSLFKRLTTAVAASDWPAGGAALTSIRTWVMANLALGVFIVAVVFIAR